MGREGDDDDREEDTADIRLLTTPDDINRILLDKDGVYVQQLQYNTNQLPITVHVKSCRLPATSPETSTMMLFLPASLSKNRSCKREADGISATILLANEIP